MPSDRVLFIAHKRAEKAVEYAAGFNSMLITEDEKKYCSIPEDFNTYFDIFVKEEEEKEKKAQATIKRILSS
jgi:hypothetical protein